MYGGSFLLDQVVIHSSIFLVIMKQPYYSNCSTFFPFSRVFLFASHYHWVFHCPPKRVSWVLFLSG